MGSKAKDASSKVHERNQTILADLLRDEDNRYCADCMAKGPRWASWNLGVFICIRCAGIHRNLGVHISRVKSVNLDAWTPEQMESIQKGGNRHAKEIYEANLPANFRRPQDDYAVEQFIRSKYEKKLYMDKGASTSGKAPPTTSSSKSARPAQQENRLKVKKTHERKSTPPKNEVMSVPRPSGSRRSLSPAPQPPLSSSSSKQPSSNSLISLESSPPPSSSSATTSSVPGLDLLTDSPMPSSSMAMASKQKASSTPDLLMGPLQSASSTQQGASFGFFTPSSSQKLAPQQQQQQPSIGLGNSSSTSDAPLLLDPSLVPEQTKQDMKDSIMSLYSSPQAQYGSYTAQGYPVNAYHYSQQQQAAMRMAQMQQLAQHKQQQMQLQQVQQQMQKIKINQQQPPPAVAVGNGTFPSTAPHGGMGGGHTLNPTLW